MRRSPLAWRSFLDRIKSFVNHEMGFIWTILELFYLNVRPKHRAHIFFFTFFSRCGNDEFCLKSEFLINLEVLEFGWFCEYLEWYKSTPSKKTKTIILAPLCLHSNVTVKVLFKIAQNRMHKLRRVLIAFEKNAKNFKKENEIFSEKIWSSLYFLTNFDRKYPFCLILIKITAFGKFWPKITLFDDFLSNFFDWIFSKLLKIECIN